MTKYPTLVGMVLLFAGTALTARFNSRSYDGIGSVGVYDTVSALAGIACLVLALIVYWRSKVR